MKMKKRIISCISSLVIAVSLFVPVYAYKNESYTTEELISRIEHILQSSGAASYDVGDLVNIDLSLFTRDEIDLQIETLKRSVANFANGNTETITYEVQNANFTPFAFYTQRVADVRTVVNGTSFIPIEVSCSMTYGDLPSAIGGGYYIVEISNISSRIYGTYVGTAEWTVNSTSWAFIGNGGPYNKAEVWVYGTLTTTIPILGTPLVSTYDHPMQLLISVI